MLRKQFAQHANAFHQWLTDTRQAMMEGTGTLESQLEAPKVRQPFLGAVHLLIPTCLCTSRCICLRKF